MGLKSINKHQPVSILAPSVNSKKLNSEISVQTEQFEVTGFCFGETCTMVRLCIYI